jgi:hypothetical protein
MTVEEFVPSAAESFYGGGSQEYVFRFEFADGLPQLASHTGGEVRMFAVSMKTGAIWPAHSPPRVEPSTEIAFSSSRRSRRSRRYTGRGGAS